MLNGTWEPNVFGMMGSCASLGYISGNRAPDHPGGDILQENGDWILQEDNTGSTIWQEQQTTIVFIEKFLEVEESSDTILDEDSNDITAEDYTP